MALPCSQLPPRALAAAPSASSRHPCSLPPPSLPWQCRGTPGAARPSCAPPPARAGALLPAAALPPSASAAEPVLAQAGAGELLSSASAPWRGEALGEGRGSLLLSAPPPGLGLGQDLSLSSREAATPTPSAAALLLEDAPAAGRAGLLVAGVGGPNQGPLLAGWGGLEPFTESEIAGLLFGAFIIACAAAAPQVDRILAASQRRDLGLCGSCGGVEWVPCPACKGPADASLDKPLCAECRGTGRVPCKACQAS